MGFPSRQPLRGFLRERMWGVRSVRLSKGTACYFMGEKCVERPEPVIPGRELEFDSIRAVLNEIEDVRVLRH